jgi:TolB-like protein/class 3 adenylate cyclase/cytochrome c-type biogenesis protein CcmH/NrfG
VVRARIQRRLAAILAIDVAGYSRLMSSDEEDTHDRLAGHRRELLEPMIREHEGRIVKNTGDGALVEFSSVVDAVRCAIEVQSGMMRRNAGVPRDRRIEFRVGINVGDVIVEPDDIYGHGVNLAARLESLADPGGICLSATAYDQVRGKVQITVRDMGERHLKNIAESVRVLAILPGTDLSGPAVSAATPGLPRLSIVVLPFVNLSGDKKQDYFVDGVTEDLTVELSRLSGAFVIARNTAFTFKGKSVDVRQVGRELGVRYVLEGSIRKARQNVRIAAQLIDADSGAHIWADRFDRNISDVFELQDAITIELARVLNVQLVEAESRRTFRTSNPDAVDLVLQARAYVNRGVSRENGAAAAQLYEKALLINPGEVQALRGLSAILAGSISDLWSVAPEDDLRRAEALATRALALDPHDPSCHIVMGLVRRIENRWEEAINSLEAAIRLNPNSSHAPNQLGWTKMFSGRSEEALPHFAEFIRISPRDPGLFLGYLGFGIVRFLNEDDTEAIEMLRKSVGLNPNYSASHLFLAAIYGLHDQLKEATAALATYMGTRPVHQTIAQLQAHPPTSNRVHLEQLARLYDGLHKAGMPEE